jgi:hypothetical protein
MHAARCGVDAQYMVMEYVLTRGGAPRGAALTVDYWSIRAPRKWNRHEPTMRVAPLAQLENGVVTRCKWNPGTWSHIESRGHACSKECMRGGHTRGGSGAIQRLRLRGGLRGEVHGAHEPEYETYGATMGVDHAGRTPRAYPDQGALAVAPYM